MTCDVVVTRKGQVTIPVELRRKFRIEEGSRVQIIEKNSEIVIKKCQSIFDLAGASAGKANIQELKRELDQLRDEDA